MDRRYPMFYGVMLAMTLLTKEAFPGHDGPGQPDVPQWTTEERQEWLGYARATWRSFESMTAPNGLTADRLQRDLSGVWRPSQRTSPTDIASYLWSALSARALGLIGDEETDRKLSATLDTLSRMERAHGFWFNFYDVRTAVPADANANSGRKPRPFLSSVDNAWLAVALTMIRNARPPLRDRVDGLLAPMDFRFFYVPFDPADPVHAPGHFHGGYFVEDQSFTAFYGMLNTEPRIISYLAIARGQVPAEQYYRLFRTFPIDRAPQSQRPQGETRTYLGIPVFEGHYRVLDMDIVPSWGGSMFEALMVPLFVPEEDWAPRSWGINHHLYVQAQIEQGMNVQRYGFWGFSPSWTPEGGYQTYGVSALATEVDGYRTYKIPTESEPRKGPPTGPVYEGIVTPHASFLALRYAPRETLENLRALRKAYPVFTEIEGFHDSVNVTTGEVSHCVLSLDQGMIMASIANTLADEASRKWFIAGPIEAAIRPLIAPEEFTVGKRR